jgi:hypothetical protein
MTMRPLKSCATLAVIALTGTLLASCGGSGSGLIPSADAGPLEHDFEEVARLAMSGNGSCTQTTEAIEKAERDFARISASIDASLRARLQEGISNLRKQALTQCAHVVTSTTSTTSQSTATSETAVASSTTTAPSSTTTTAATTSAGSPRNEEPSGGGTRAPGEGAEEGGSESGGGGAPGDETGPTNPGGGTAGEIGNQGRGR